MASLPGKSRATSQIRGLGVIPFITPEGRTAKIAVGAVSTVLSVAGTVASVRAFQGERQTIWKVVFGIVGLALAGNTIRSAIETVKVL